MVKIAGKCNKPGGINFIPGATYVGDSRILGLVIFLEQGHSSTVLLSFNDRKPLKIDYLEFARSVDFLEAFSKGTAESYESPESNALKISLVMLDSNRVLLRWDNLSFMLLPLEFFQALNVLVAIRKKLKSLVQRRLERKKLLQQNSLSELLSNWGGLALFAILLAIDLLLLISLFMFSTYLPHFIALTIFMTLWLLIQRPQWSQNLGPFLREYMDERLLNDLANIHWPRRMIEIIVIMLIISIFYALFGSEAANFIIKYYKGNQLP